MTQRRDADEPKLPESDQLASSELLRVNRREVISAGAAGIAFLANFDSPALADEIETAGREPEQQQQRTVNSTDGNTYRTEQKPEERAERYSDIVALLGSEFRGRASSIQDLSSHQLIGTGTREEPDRREVDAGDYFSDGFNRKLGSNSESPLATAYRTMTNLPDKVTISIGKEAKGAPGRTPLFSLTMVDFSRRGIGGSETVGIGANNRGVYLSVSTMNGERSWSIGVYAGSPKAVGMAAINVSDLVKNGRLTVEVGVLLDAGRGEAEISMELQPIYEGAQFLSNVLGSVLGPLSDYRNFQDPLMGF